MTLSYAISKVPEEFRIGGVVISFRTNVNSWTKAQYLPRVVTSTEEWLKESNWYVYKNIYEIIGELARAEINNSKLVKGVGDIFKLYETNELYLVTEYHSPSDYTISLFAKLKKGDICYVNNEIFFFQENNSLLNNTIQNGVVKNNNIPLSQGTLNSEGNDLASDTRVRVEYISALDRVVSLYLLGEFKFITLCKYAAGNTNVFIESKVINRKSIVLEPNYIYRISISKNDNSAVHPLDIENKLFVSDNINFTFEGIGTMLDNNSGVTKVGDVYFNTNINAFYKCTSYTASNNFDQVLYAYPIDGNIYLTTGGLTYVSKNGKLIKQENQETFGNIIFTGDSIPHGQTMQGSVSTPYPNIVASRLGMSLTNYSIGGSTFAQTDNLGGTFGTVQDFNKADKDISKYYIVMTGNQTYNTYKFEKDKWTITNIPMRTPISARYQFMRDDADVIVVAASTNDFQYNWTEIGTMEDRSPNTFYGAVHYTILGLLDKYKTKTIIFMTPIKRCQTQKNTTADTLPHQGGNYGHVDSVNEFGKTLQDYASILKEVCAYYSIPVIDAYSISGLNPHVDSQLSLFDSYKTHPLQPGHDMLARVVVAQIKSYIGSSIAR